ncbi:MAG: glycosyltransferase family 2 protein [Arcanobacterium sp.]|nr:glycosyltransferase family 2 protein [Arcanobacterium sp.]
MSQNITAVVVTFNRLEYLKRILNRLLTISEISKIIVVDNHSTDGTRKWLESLTEENLTPLFLTENKGGAGGFHEGLKSAFSSGSDYFWLMDDDGLPNPDCLSKLLPFSNEFDFIGPAVVAEHDNQLLCFPVRIPNTVTPLREYNALKSAATNGVIPGVVIPFNGVLLSSSLVSKIGFPRAEFFIWGDDVEYLWRAEAAGVKIGTVVDSIFQHPMTDDLGTPMMFHKTTYNHSPSDLKHFCMVRNNTVNLLKYRSVAHVGAFWLKTLWFYSFVKPSVSRLKISVIAASHGLKGIFSGHQKFLR